MIFCSLYSVCKKQAKINTNFMKMYWQIYWIKIPYSHLLDVCRNHLRICGQFQKCVNCANSWFLAKKPNIHVLYYNTLSTFLYSFLLYTLFLNSKCQSKSSEFYLLVIHPMLLMIVMSFQLWNLTCNVHFLAGVLR